MEEEVLVTLQYLREYRTYFHISEDWNVSESTICRTVHKVEKILIRSGYFSLSGKKELMKEDKETVLVMDNASIHQNKQLWEKEKEWEKKGLKIFFLPPYSPQLNKIEILWRFMKYEWLENSCYNSYLDLVKGVENILINFGSKYTINFA